MRKLVSIYAITNPVSRKVFYIGATTKDLNVRLKQHIYQWNSSTGASYGSISSRKEILDKILAAGKYPKIKLLELCTFGKANEREAFYFKKYRSFVVQKRTGNFTGQFTRLIKKYKPLSGATVFYAKKIGII